MYVRWQIRKGTLTATLAECRRVDGKPRQTSVAYLGSIGVGFIYHPCWCRSFWRRVTARLDRLGNQLGAAERAAIEARLAARVARPTADEVARFMAELRKVEAPLDRLIAALPRRDLEWTNLGYYKLAEIEKLLPLIDQAPDEHREWAMQEVALSLGVTWTTVMRVWRRAKVREALAATPDRRAPTLRAIAERYGLSVSSVRRHLMNVEIEARRSTGAGTAP